MRVYATRVLYAPTSHCSRCDWHMTDVVPAKLRREVRKHVRKTGHTVWVDTNTAYRYEAYPDPPSR
jgi:hypothetical protein